MKVVHIIASCATGGAEIFAKSLITSLKQEGVDEIELWVMSRVRDIDPNNTQKIKFEKLFIDEVEANGIAVKFINKRPRKDWYKSIKRLREEYDFFKPDIVHTHLESVTFHACRALLKFKVPIVQTIHSTDIKYPFIQKNYISKRIKAYIAISDKVSDNIKNIIKIKDDKLFLLYNGIKVEEFYNKEKVIHDKVKKVLSVGRLTKAKDHKTLLYAFHILKTKLSKAGYSIPELLIVGDGELKEMIVKLTHNLDLDRNVKFLGIREDIPALLNESDIYVMSSEWEGLSISLIEALASCIPIVATDAGSNNEIIDNGINGLIVPIKSPEALAEGLFSLIINQNLRRELSKNSKNMLFKFDIKDCASQHIKAYKKITKS